MAGVVQYLCDGYKYLFEDLVHIAYIFKHGGAPTRDCRSAEADHSLHNHGVSPTAHSVTSYDNHFNINLLYPISKDYFLVSHPLKLISILVAYNIFCLRLGPWLMKDRKPYDLKNVIKLYNIFQIFISIYLFYVGTTYVFAKEFDFRCAPADDPTSERAAKILPNIHIFFLVKLIDLLDTVFFVLRKSFRQITSLHVHHHTMMPIATWIAITYYPGGQAVLIGYVNALVHAVMYSYYLIAGLGEEYKKYLWWKKYLTMMQLVQFTIFIIQSTLSLFYDCGYPTILKIITIIYAATFINLFGKFYYNAYVKTNKNKNVQNGHSKVKTAKVY